MSIHGLKARRAALALTSTAVGLCGTGGVVSAHARPVPCQTEHAVTVVSDHLARVFSVGGAVYGCSKLDGTTTKLGDEAGLGRGRDEVGPIVLAADLTAYALYPSGPGPARIVVRRLFDGRTLHNNSFLAMHARLAPDEVDSSEGVDAIVLKPDGAVAWTADERIVAIYPCSIGTCAIRSRRRYVEVHRDDQTGESLLDHGAAINPTSLRTHRSRLSWRDGTMTRFAALR